MYVISLKLSGKHHSLVSKATSNNETNEIVNNDTNKMRESDISVDPENFNMNMTSHQYKQLSGSQLDIIDSP